MTDAENIVRLDKVTRRFGERVVLDELTLNIPAGEFVALLGRSGSGKTTLLRLLDGLDTPTSGSILVPHARTTVFQEPRLVSSQRVRSNVLLGLPKRRHRAAADRVLEEVGLGAKADSWPGLLSGGEAQRVALARALVREPKLLMLDEPFAALDALTRSEMQLLVRRLCAEHGPATLFVTHDVGEAILLADRIIVLSEGYVVVDRRVEIGDRNRDLEAVATLRRELIEALGVALPEQQSEIEVSR